MNRRRKIRMIAGIILIVIIIIAVIVIGMIIEKHTPTKEHMSYREYFDIRSDDKVVFLNNERIEADVVVENGMVYMTLDFVNENFNKRFYLDIKDNFVMYTTADTIYYFETDTDTYTDKDGTEYSEDYTIVKDVDGIMYLALDFVMKYADFNYRYYEEPDRIILWNVYGTSTCTYLNKDNYMRFDKDIKSPVIRDVTSDDLLEIIESYDDGWAMARSEDGYTGYVQKKYYSDTFELVTQSSFVPEPEPESLKTDGKVNLVWQPVGAAVGGQTVSNALSGTKGINVISPTWYSITDNNGEISSYANKNYVDTCHAVGIEVWPLIDDFNKEIDGVTIYSNRQTREKIITRLISDSRTYGFDGINIDFEKVTDESAVHFLQFIRELSQECKKEGLILSIDNYVPASHNMHYDRQEQGVWADYIIIMGYDEHWAGSEAGSVASIGFVRNGIEDTISEVPSSKVINAMPFYTRIWVETPNSDGTVTTTSKAVGMETAYNTIRESGYPAVWDEECAQYYCSYEYAAGNSVVKIWLEDARSIEEKMKLFEEYDLAGVGAWRLGFETKDVWDVINKYIN